MGSLLAVVAVGACTPTYYAPNTQNVPLLRAQGEVVGAVATDGNRFEAQGAYAATDRIGLQLGGTIFRPSDLDNGNGGSGHLVDAGIGYFAPLNDDFLMEVYGVAGFGGFENDFPEGGATTGGIEGKLLRVGVQPAIGYRRGRVEVAASTRFSRLSYSSVSGDLVEGGVDQVERLSDESSYLLLEPALTVRGGTGRVMLQLQAGWSVNLTDSDFPQDDSMLTFGVLFRLPSTTAR